jgi:hypothetical protein
LYPPVNLPSPPVLDHRIGFLTKIKTVIIIFLLESLLLFKLSLSCTGGLLLSDRNVT